MNEALEIAADLASQQWGLVTSAQARSLGVAAFQMSRTSWTEEPLCVLGQVHPSGVSAFR